MTIGPLAQWFAFIIFTLISVAGALGMATTMSMFRSGIFLMASFIGVAGLFILLSADLLALLQIMMYIGGMLVMILFMVLFSHDPGGSMMAGMDMSVIENFFSRGLKSRGMEGMDHGNPGEGNGGDSGGMHGSQHSQAEMQHGRENHGGHSGHGGMDMSMTTPVKKAAALLGTLTGFFLVLLLVLRPAWPPAAKAPDPHSAERVGQLLMGKYMMAFEGAGLLILLGIFGAVLMARPGKYPDKSGRKRPVAVDEPPPPVTDDRLQPLLEPENPPEIRIIDIHKDNREEN